MSTPNPVYNKLDNRIQNITKEEGILNKRGDKIEEGDRLERIQKIKERGKTKSTVPNPDGVKIYYVRYADD
jgi:hypothetical protein